MSDETTPDTRWYLLGLALADADLLPTQGVSPEVREKLQRAIAYYDKRLPPHEALALRVGLRDLLEITERQDAEWDDIATLDERIAIHKRAHALLRGHEPRGRILSTPEHHKTTKCACGQPWPCPDAMRELKPGEWTA